MGSRSLRAARGLAVAGLMAAACSSSPPAEPLVVPHGYVSRLEVAWEGRRYGFGPFVGYYFRPGAPNDLTHLHFLCYNERHFYASAAPENALLYEGEARLSGLPAVGFPLPAEGGRIRPVLFSEAPAPWLATRPEPQAEFVHFHSAYDATGPALVGYWLRHGARRSFTYDMGGRVGPEGPLHHPVEPGPDRSFAHLVEFDEGPKR